MATSPSDQNNQNVIAWLDRLQSSVRDAGHTGGARAFLEPRNLAEDDSDGDSEGKRAGRAATFYTQPKSEDIGNDDTLVDSDPSDMQSALPDATVPLGLIADLSLSNSKKSKKKDAQKDIAGISEEDLNDDNVVSSLHSVIWSEYSIECFTSRVWQTKHTSCQVCHFFPRKNLR